MEREDEVPVVLGFNVKPTLLTAIGDSVWSAAASGLYAAGSAG